MFFIFIPVSEALSCAGLVVPMRGHLRVIVLETEKGRNVEVLAAGRRHRERRARRQLEDSTFKRTDITPFTFLSLLNLNDHHVIYFKLGKVCSDCAQ